MLKLLIPLIILVVICLFAGVSGLKLLGFMALCAAGGVLIFFLLRFLAQKFPKLFAKLGQGKSPRKEEKTR